MKKILYILLFVPLALFGQNISISLQVGWNMFGYICPESIDLELGLTQYVANIMIVKDNQGAVYLPEWGFNGIGDLTPGLGYQIKLIEPIQGFNLCDWYIFQLTNEIENTLTDSLLYMNQFFGCTDPLACNFSSVAQIDNQNCVYPDENYDCAGTCNNLSACNFALNEQCIYPVNGYDCSGDSIMSVDIGELAYGGLVFHVSQDGKSGLVISEPIQEGAEFFDNANFCDGGGLSSGFYWDNYEYDQKLGNTGIESSNSLYDTPNLPIFGYNYTLATTSSSSLSLIVSNSIINGYDDWFIPSQNEFYSAWRNLFDIGVSLGFDEEYGNVCYHWVSGYTSAKAFASYWYPDPDLVTPDQGLAQLRLVRAFGDYSSFCKNPLACNNYNYSIELSNGLVLIDNTLCEFPEDGYDCDGNPVVQIGDTYKGGTVFHIDSTGVHGFVSSVELSNIEWGCNGLDIIGADNSNLGFGDINTNDVYENCLLNNELSCSMNSNAVSMCLEFSLFSDINSNSSLDTLYDDWYLPSKDELLLLFTTLESSYDFEENQYYWTSTEYDSSKAWVLYTETGEMELREKFFTAKVIPIRSF